MAEAQACQLREGGKEVTGQPGERSRAVVVDIIHLAAKVVDGVVAAKQDAVVAGDAVVMKLVGHVGNALPVLPADGRQLPPQRLGHQHIVVHRDGVPAIALEQRGKALVAHHAGGIQHARRASLPGCHGCSAVTRTVRESAPSSTATRASSSTSLPG
jgi:hypothetical protein